MRTSGSPGPLSVWPIYTPLRSSGGSNWLPKACVFSVIRIVSSGGGTVLARVLVSLEPRCPRAMNLIRTEPCEPERTATENVLAALRRDDPVILHHHDHPQRDMRRTPQSDAGYPRPGEL